MRSKVNNFQSAVRIEFPVEIGFVIVNIKLLPYTGNRISYFAVAYFAFLNSGISVSYCNV